MAADQPTDSAGPLPRLLSLRALGDDRFEGHNPGEWPGGRVFGGLVAGQALAAAIETVAVPHRPHSMHAYFLRPGAIGVPITYRVARHRDGRSFTTREVVAVQRDEVIFSMIASFHGDEPGEDYQLPMAPDAPRPDDRPDVDGAMERLRSMRFVDFRDVGPTEPGPDGVYRSTRRVWFRVTDQLPDDPGVHACMLAFMSDMGAVLAARRPRPSAGPPWEGFMGASLDHAIWFHRPVRADQWLFYDLQAVSIQGSRGLVRGSMHTEDGVLAVSIAQEALVRELKPEAKPRWQEGPEAGSV